MIQQRHLDQVEGREVGNGAAEGEDDKKAVGGSMRRGSLESTTEGDRDASPGKPGPQHGNNGNHVSSVGKGVSSAGKHLHRGGNNVREDDDNEGYNKKAQRKIRNAPDERTRRQLTRSSRSPFSQGGGGGTSTTRRASENFSQFGHGSGSKVTELHAFSGKRKMIARNEEKER